MHFPFLRKGSILALLVLLSCSDPTGMCACPPATHDAVVFGRVSDAAGAAVRHARIQATIETAGCGQPGFRASEEAVAQLDGSYRLYLRTPYEPKPGSCLRIRALPASGDTISASEWKPFAVGFATNQVVDSVRVDLVLP